MKILYLTLLFLTLKSSLEASDFGLILPRYLTGDSLFVHRFETNPLIHEDIFPDAARYLDNVNGPSVIKVPEWVEEPLGRYYMYFSHHNGRFIRLAFADSLQGPWFWFEGGVLDFEDTILSNGNRQNNRGHLASPDVHVDEVNQQIVMYFHRTMKESVELIGNQGTFVAISGDGIHFAANKELLGHSYFRVFESEGQRYALAKNKNIGGVLYKAANNGWSFNDPEDAFYFFDSIRHTAVVSCENYVIVFYSLIGDTPERLMARKMYIEDYENGKVTLGPALELIRPEFDYEGVNLPIQTSVSGAAKTPVHELRDPAVYRDYDRTYLFYSMAGEMGISGGQIIGSNGKSDVCSTL